MTATLDPNPSMIDRIRHDLVGLNMPRALEALDHVVRRLDHGELSALEAIDILLSEEMTLRENSHIKTALRMGRLATIKTRRLRLHLPALAGPGSHFYPGPTRVRGPSRSGSFPRPTGNGKEPSCHGARRRSRQGRKERVFQDARQSHRFACQFRTGRQAAGTHSLLLQAEPAHRR